MTDPVPSGRPGSALARRSWMLAVFIAVVGVGLSLWFWRQRAMAESRALQEEFRREAETLRHATEREVRLFLDVLDSIRVLHTLSERISDEDFEEFVRKGMLHQQNVLGAFGFVQRIRHDLRGPLEQASDTTGRPGLALLESDGRGGYGPAGTREEYFVLTYQTPAGGLGLPTGYDYASWAPAARAIALMQVREGPVIGGLGLPGSTGEPPGWHVFSPIYYAGLEGVFYPPPGWLVGYVTALFKPEEILDRALAGVPADRFSVELIEPAEGPMTADRMTYEDRIPVADREWLFRCRPGPAFARNRGPRQAGLLLAAGLGLTALISWQLAMVGRRTRQIERLVHLRTTALREAHERIAREMDERMRLEDEIHSTAAREQERVGHDLHDSLGQKLTGAMFLSRGLLRQLEQDGRAESESARRLNETLKDAVAEVRRMARGLVPVAIGEDGLADALRRLAEESRQTFGIACMFRQSSGHPPVGPAAEELYYIAREAIHNAARHARPRLIQIDLAEEAGRWRLSVEDDGCGMPPEPEQRGGLGLRIMRHRAATVGAAIEFTALPGGGTRMVCRPGGA
jgi:signal transduction histidine kinase